MYWKQDIYIKYTPRILLCKDEADNKDGLNYHMNSIFERYNAISIVCLINKKKDELLLGQAYERSIQPLLNQFPEYIIIYLLYIIHQILYIPFESTYYSSNISS